MDPLAILAALSGALLLGAALAFAALRPGYTRARREHERLRRQHTELGERLAAIEESARRASELAETGVENPTREAHRVMRTRADAQLAVARGLEDLERALGAGVGTSKGAVPGGAAADAEANARRAEQAAQEQGQRVRALASEAELVVAAAQSSGTIATALGEVLGGLDRGADSVASAANETGDAAAIMEMALRKLQEGAAETAQHSANVATEAERGYRAVHHTLDEMERIRGLAEEAGRGIEALGGRVLGVGDVVRVIQEIAEKTNLLALNASIIAAQAGEHGRSFAVVAQEIKALAQKTASSTKQISELIRGVRAESQRAMDAMSTGVHAIGQGFQVALAAGDALGEIRQGARVAQRKVQGMMRAMDEESSAAGRVIDAARLLAERAASMAAAVKEHSQQRGRLADATQGIMESGGRMTRLAREQLEGGRTVLDVVTRLASDTLGAARGQRELRRQIDRIHNSAAQLSGLETDVTARLGAVTEAVGQLREELARLQQP